MLIPSRRGFPAPWFIVVVWLVEAAVLVMGYYWQRQGKIRRALAAVVTYCASSFLVFGHYLYGTPRELDLLMNFLIFLEGAAALVLLGYFLAFARRDMMGSAV